MHKKTAVFGGGCFWCTEAVFKSLKGVEKVISGYSGGDIPNPTYEAVSSGSTGHAEVIQITFDPQIISYKTLLEVFFKLHDPTTLNKQGNDEGTQYRSVIFYENETQQKEAEESKKEMQKNYDKPIVTKIEPLKKFYPAEDYHQEYYKRNSDQSYCQIIIDPKIQKLKKDFSDLVAKDTLSDPFLY